MIHNIETLWTAEDSQHAWQNEMRSENAQRQISNAVFCALETGGSIRDAVFQVIKLDPELIDLFDF